MLPNVCWGSRFSRRSFFFSHIKFGEEGAELLEALCLPVDLIYGNEVWVVTDRMRLRIQAVEISFLCRVVDSPLDRVKSSVICEKLKVEPLLLYIERSK